MLPRADEHEPVQEPKSVFAWNQAVNWLFILKDLRRIIGLLLGTRWWRCSRQYEIHAFWSPVHIQQWLRLIINFKLVLVHEIFVETLILFVWEPGAWMAIVTDLDVGLTFNYSNRWIPPQHNNNRDCPWLGTTARQQHLWNALCQICILCVVRLSGLVQCDECLATIETCLVQHQRPGHVHQVLKVRQWPSFIGHKYLNSAYFWWVGQSIRERRSSRL